MFYNEIKLRISPHCFTFKLNREATGINYKMEIDCYCSIGRQKLLQLHVQCCTRNGNDKKFPGGGKEIFLI